MKSKLKKKHVLWIVGIFEIFVGVSGFAIMQTIKDPLDLSNFSQGKISDELKMKILIAELRQSIREQRLQDLDKMVDDDFSEISYGKVLKKNNLKDRVEKMFKYRTKKMKPVFQTFGNSDDPIYTSALAKFQESSTSDFDIVLESISVVDGKVLVQCRFQLFGELKEGKLEKEEKIQLQFTNKDGEWRINKSDNLMRFF